MAGDDDDGARARGERRLRRMAHQRLAASIGDELRASSRRLRRESARTGPRRARRRRSQTSPSARLRARGDLHQQPADAHRLDVGAGDRHAGENAVQHPVEAVLLGRARAAGSADDRQVRRARPAAADCRDRPACRNARSARRSPRSRAGMTSRRSVIAEAPKIDQRVAVRARAVRARRASASGSCATRSSATIVAPAGARRASSARSVLATTLVLRPGSRVETTAKRSGRNGATDTAPRRRQGLAGAPRAPRRGAAKGMILTVAAMSPAATGAKRRQRRHGDRLVDAVDRGDRVARRRRRGPASRANRLTRPVNGGSQAQMGAGETLGQAPRRFVLADVAGLEPRRDDVLDARRAQRAPALGVRRSAPS